MVAIIRAMWPYLRPYRKILYLALAAMLGETVTALLSPWPLKFVFDGVLLEHPANGNAHVRSSLGHEQWVLLAIITGVAIAIALADALFSYFDTQLSEVASQRAVYELRRAVFGHLQRLSVAYHHSAETRLGDLLSRLSGDIGALQSLAAEGVSNIITNGLTLVCMMGVVLWLDRPIGVAAIVLTLPTALYARRNTTRMRQAMRAARRQEGQVSAVMQESLSYVKLVQAYGREDHESSRVAAVSDLSLAANIRAATLLARLTPSVSLHLRVRLRAADRARRRPGGDRAPEPRRRCSWCSATRAAPSLRSASSRSCPSPCRRRGRAWSGSRRSCTSSRPSSSASTQPRS